ncbi:MAG: substrate-binding domain-containing protein [Clostridia bacterium]|nr:substrate-binding domain-containing protein [Clostridia bacterium]
MLIKKQAKPTIHDIAKAANVSLATVSNVLSGKRQVSSQSGQRVLAIAKEMGYKRSPTRKLRRTIRLAIVRVHGLVIMDTPFFSELIAGIEQECQRNQYELLITYINLYEGIDAQARIDSIVRDDSMALLLLGTEMNEKTLALFQRTNVPMVVLDSLFHHQNVNTVVMNNFEAGYIATRHLLDHGHKRVGIIISSIDFNNMRDRSLGYQAALTEHGIKPLDTDRFPVEPTMDGSARDMQMLLEGRQGNLPTAFFAANDIMAVGASRAMKTLGMRLPQDASVIGMDDVPVCQVVNPTLSTISVPKGTIGATAVRRLIQMVEETDQACLKTQVGVELVVRESVITRIEHATKKALPLPY